MNLARRAFLANDAQENAGAVEESVRFVQMRAAYRQIPGMNFANDAERLPCAQRRGLPGVFVKFAEAYRPAA